MSLTESNDYMPHYCKDLYTSCEVRYCVFIILLIVFMLIAFYAYAYAYFIICFAYLYNSILKMSCKCQDLHIDVYSQ